MTAGATMGSDDLWLAIRREAAAAVAADRFLEASAAFILDQGDLGGAIAFGFVPRNPPKPGIHGPGSMPGRRRSSGGK